MIVMATVRQGPVEKSTRAMVRALGKISARQQVTAHASYRLARLIDLELDGSKAAALSRELRQLVAAITPMSEVLPVRPQVEVHHDPVQALQDEVARKRAQRHGAQRNRG
jgi:hypothetical protein